MRNRPKQILLRLLSGIVLMLVGSISLSYGQGTPVDFAGTWNTVTGKGKKIVITFETVRRTTVAGTYAVNGLTASYKPLPDLVTAFVKVSATIGGFERQSLSTIRGTVTENVLRFKWQEDGGGGAGRFTMSPDGRSFQGTFSLTDNPDDTSGGTWNGTRATIFNGVWQTTTGGKVQYPELLFQQSGSRVVGRLFGNRPDLGVIKEGIITGNTLRFQIWRPPVVPGQNLPDIFLGTGELVMSPDGKSFKGTILGAAAAGTRLGAR